MRVASEMNSVRSSFKNVIFWTYVHAWRPLPSRLLGLKNSQRLIVLLYHRVNDDMRDSLTVGTEQFDRQMEWISLNHTVVSIEDVVLGKVLRSSKRPLIAVTFDDGYRDNYENAVPILLRHHVPAAFFVSTGMIGKANGFAHDLAKGIDPLPTMTWEQLIEMRRLGFTIGSHSVTHINCAAESEQIVRRELVESQATLKEKLELDKVIFAYPFGGKADITPKVIDMAREVGYIGCLSAYGGYARREIDPYNVLRMGIDHKFSMAAFRARLEGWGNANA